MLPEVRKILYCTQMGPNAAYVFRYAYSVARRFDARITILYVIEGLNRRQRALVERYSGGIDLSGVVDRAEDEAAQRLPRRLEEFFRLEPDETWRDRIEEIVVVRGRAHEEILSQARSRGVDLVVIGAHRGPTLPSPMFGSTARRLLESSETPVLTVRVPEGHRHLSMDDTYDDGQGAAIDDRSEPDTSAME